jgi:hypothetical protein
MNGKRQKIQDLQALAPKDRGESPVGGCAETLVAKPAPENPACAEQLMEEVCNRGNKELGNAFEATRVVLAWMG